MTAPHIFLALDLEMSQPSNRIIQIGACIGDLRSGEILDTFSEFVNPHEEISPYIEKLTGITNQQLQESGIELQEAYKNLVSFWDAPHTQYEPADRFYQLVVWGGGDGPCLRSQLPSDVGWRFGRRELDVKTIHQFVQLSGGKKPQSGLAKSLTRYNLKFEGSKHNALDDSINTFRLFAHLAGAPK